VKIVAHFVVVTILVTTVVAGGWRVAAAPSKTLVFEGTVTSITTIHHRLTPWLVTVKITKVISGGVFWFDVPVRGSQSSAVRLGKGSLLYHRSGMEGPWLYRRRKPMATTELEALNCPVILESQETGTNSFFNRLTN
jgi:hypothetical protein